RLQQALVERQTTHPCRVRFRFCLQLPLERAGCVLYLKPNMLSSNPCWSGRPVVWAFACVWLSGGCASTPTPAAPFTGASPTARSSPSAEFAPSNEASVASTPSSVPAAAPTAAPSQVPEALTAQPPSNNTT